MKYLFSTTAFTSLALSVLAHEGHHDDQMPLEYVKFPYQAAYPGDNES